VSLGVLIVEDESEFRKYLVDTIPWSRYEMRVVGAVDDVASARTVLARQRVDLVLLDITLQRSDGLDLVDDIKTLAPQPRIIVITGHSEFETVRRALRLGVDDYLLKPFARQELVMSVVSNREHLLERIQEHRHRVSLQERMTDSWLFQLMRSQSHTESEHLGELLLRQEVTLPTPPRVLICAEVVAAGAPRPLHRRRVGELADLWKLTVRQIDGIAWSGLDDRIYSLLRGSESSEVGWEAQDIAREFAGHAQKRLPFEVRIGISTVDTGDLELRTLHGQAVTALTVTTSTAPVVVWNRELDPVDPSVVTARDGTVDPPHPAGRGEYEDTIEAGPALHRRHRAAREFIDDYHRDPTLDVQTVASHLGISTEYLRRAFQRIEGISCIDAITARRIDHAKVLLRSESIPIAEVAERSGFRDPAYFSRQFRRYVGMTPREYRLR